jgi:hypothetical protein
VVRFRIAHISLKGQNGGSVTANREQTVKISLGPKGAFENGNIGALMRQVPAARVLSAVPPGRGKYKPPKEPKTPHVVEPLRKAIEWQGLRDSDKITNQAEIPRHGLRRSHLPLPNRENLPAPESGIGATISNKQNSRGIKR